MIRAADILPLAEYERRRGRLRERAMSARAARRLQLGPHASLIFENEDTIRYQIQEILRVERISDPHAIGEEIRAYAQLVPSPAELAATLFIEYPDRAERDRALANLVGVERHLHLVVRGEHRTARFDPGQTDGTRVSAVQFIRFPLAAADMDAFRAGAPMRVVLDHPRYRAEATVPRALAAQLAADLDQAAGAGADSAPDTSSGDESMSMYRSPSKLPEEARARLVDALNARLADGLDLHSQIKVAHWNVKGPHFASLHPLFDSFASAAGEANDEIAERAVALGALTSATSRRSAQVSRVAELPIDKTDGLALVGLLVERFDAYLSGLRTAREVAAELGDGDTEDLLTQHVTAFEKHAWFLHATLAR